MKLIQKIGLGFSVVALALAFSVSTVKPAAATTHCGLGNRLCLWDVAGFNGSAVSLVLPSPGNCMNLPSNWKNRADSLANNSSNELTFYNNDNCQGVLFDIGAYTERYTLYTINNTINSVFVSGP